MSEQKSAIRSAAQAHTNLTMFHAVIQLMEGGCLHGAPPEAAQIIAVAKRAAGRELRAYDRAVARALSKGPNP